jgi:hypothetical protein
MRHRELGNAIMGYWTETNLMHFRSVFDNS